MCKMQSESNVVQFFEGKVVFVTGATGFLGKVLVSKLLSTCPGLETVYVLIRRKKENDVKKRFDDFLKDDVSISRSLNTFFILSKVK